LWAYRIELTTALFITCATQSVVYPAFVCLCVCLCVLYNDNDENDTRSTAIFQNNPSKPVLECQHSEMKEVAVTTGVIKRAKLQSNWNLQQTDIQLITGQMHFLSPKTV